MSDDFEKEEYFTIVDIVGEFDKRLLTVKGWGVTLSLAILGFGFQYKSYGLFLVAAASSLAFWSIEAVMKRHQMRYYPRMREIEANRYETAPEKEKSAPRIDWAWEQAENIYKEGTALTEVERRGKERPFRWGWLFLHVALPHAITLILGGLLFWLGVKTKLCGFTFGAMITK